MHRRTLFALPVLAAPAVHAQSLINVRFTLDWAFQGPQAAFLLALERGHFRREGLNVTMDRGTGSGDVPLRILQGTHDVGVADINPTIRLRLERPDADVFTPFIVYDSTALAVMSTRAVGVRTPQDLVGKTIAAPDSDAGRQLFPAFARAAGIDAASVRWLSVTPQLRESMLARGQAQAITGFITSGIFSLRQLGIADADQVVMRYSDVGANFFATSVITSRRWANANPAGMTGLIRALVRAQYETLADPTAAASLLRAREPLTDLPLETERLRMALEQLTFTPHVRANGFGQVNTTRLQSTIDMIRAAFSIDRPMPWSDIYDPRFLPPAGDLRA